MFVFLSSMLCDEVILLSQCPKKGAFLMQYVFLGHLGLNLKVGQMLLWLPSDNSCYLVIYFFK